MSFTPTFNPNLSVSHFFCVLNDNDAGIFEKPIHLSSSLTDFNLISDRPFIFFKLFLVKQASSIQYVCFLNIGNSKALNNSDLVIHSKPFSSLIHNLFTLIVSISIFC